jgi:asparagine synthase (glutamine-hydrolysing)
MCGIGGIIGRDDPGLIRAKRMRAALAHRGPDDSGIERPHPHATLVHTRLAIVDLSPAGHQPMAEAAENPFRSAWVVFNGEIYNHRELRAELEGLGERCFTASDTEVILRAYRAWGAGFVSRVRGMFAICIVDPERARAHLYRDRLGIKPLYLSRPESGGVIFSSEMRAILSAAGDLIPARANRTALESFFAQGAVQGAQSVVEGIVMLAPGQHLTLDLDSGRELALERYWNIPNSGQAITDRESAVERLHEVLLDSVRLHLQSDAPLGLFLSGGIDSTAILTVASEGMSRELKTITVGFDSPELDESARAREVARRFGALHEIVAITANEACAAFDGVLAAMDQPTVDGANVFIVSRAARAAGVTVAVSGLGGDELFGGYATFTDVPRALAMRSNPALRLAMRVGGAIQFTRGGAKLAEAAARNSDALAMYLLRRELFLPDERRALQSLPDGCCPTSGLPLQALAEVAEDSAGRELTDRISVFELELYTRHMLLRDGDVFSMAAPIEYRVPLLDHNVVEAALAIPPPWKHRGPRPKQLLIDAAGSRFPLDLVEGSKRGFKLPWAGWFAPGGSLTARARDAAHDSATWRDLGIAPEAVANTWKRWLQHDRRISPLQILAVATLNDFAHRHKLHA